MTARSPFDRKKRPSYYEGLALRDAALPGRLKLHAIPKLCGQQTVLVIVSFEAVTS